MLNTTPGSTSPYRGCGPFAKLWALFKIVLECVIFLFFFLPYSVKCVCILLSAQEVIKYFIMCWSLKGLGSRQNGRLFPL